LVGKWTLDKDAPSLKEAKSVVKRIEFTDDGMFAAQILETQADGQRKTVAKQGKYEFNGFQLKLSTKERDTVYGAMLIMNKTLELKREGDKFKLSRLEED
jgi:hypothetical protein